MIASDREGRPTGPPKVSLDQRDPKITKVYLKKRRAFKGNTWRGYDVVKL